MSIIVEAKNLSLVREESLGLDIDNHDLVILTQDKQQCLFTVADVDWLLHRCQTKIQFVEAATREEMLFAVGTIAAGYTPCILVQMDLPIPKTFQDTVQCVSQKPKKSSVRRSVTKVKKNTCDAKKAVENDSGASERVSDETNDELPGQV